MQIRIDDLFSQAKKAVKDKSEFEKQAPHETVHKPNVVLFGPMKPESKAIVNIPAENCQLKEQTSIAMEIEEKENRAETSVASPNQTQSSALKMPTWIPHSKRSRYARFRQLARSQPVSMFSAVESVDENIEDMLNPFESMLNKERKLAAKNGHNSEQLKEILDIVETENAIFGQVTKVKDEYERDYDKGKVKKIKKKKQKTIIDLQKIYEAKFSTNKTN